MTLNVYNLLRKCNTDKEEYKKYAQYLSFSPSNSHFCVGIEDGYRVFVTPSMNDTEIKEETKKLTEGTVFVEMFQKCPLLAMMGGGRNPAFSKEKVSIWDYQKQKCVAEIISPQEIYGFRVLSQQILIISLYQIDVYESSTLIRSIKTGENSKAICATCHDQMLIAVPHEKKGHVLIVSTRTNIERVIDAHESHIGCLCISKDGTHLATASERGTVIKIFNIRNGSKLREFRRGSSWAEIYSIAFSNDCKFVCCTSNTGTVHIFSMEYENFSLLNYVYTYEKSFANYKIDGHGFGHGLCAFSEDSKSVIGTCTFKFLISPTVITSKGKCFLLNFDLKGNIESKMFEYHLSVKV